MMVLIRAELLKLRTMRVTYGLLGIAAALCAVFTLLEANRAGTAGTGVPPLSTADGLRTVTTVTGFALLLAAILGAIAADGEFRHGTATLTYLLFPKRGWVLLAKAGASAVAGLVFGLVAGVLSTGLGLIVAAGRHDHVALSAGALAGHVGGVMVAGALLGALGVAVGSLVRSQLAAIVGIFVWAIIIESVLGGLFTWVRPYLPYTTATTLGGTALGNAAFGPAHGVAGSGPLPFLAAAALLAAMAATVALIAGRTTVQRDIT
jgi:ABC-2 type transport system permease protein